MAPILNSKLKAYHRELSKNPKDQPAEDPEDRGGRWLLNGIIWFVSALFIAGSISQRYLPGVGFGAVLAFWRVMATREITNYLSIKLNWKGRKQTVTVQNSPGAQTVAAQGESVTQIIVPATPTDHELADLVYTPLRNEISGWKDPRYASFSVLELLDKQIPRLVKKIRPDIAKWLNDAKYLFDDINVLRAVVSTLIRDESNRLAQEFQPKFFDSGSKVVFNNLRVMVNGQDLPFYLPHIWVMRQTPIEYVRTLVKENHPHMTQRGLELIVIGERDGNQLSKVAAKDEDAIRFGERVMKYLGTQEPATRLQNNFKKVQELGGKLLPLIDEELTKG
jgi:hypothetical protein